MTGNFPSRRGPGQHALPMKFPRRRALVSLAWLWAAFTGLSAPNPAWGKKKKKKEEPAEEDRRPAVTFAGFRMLKGGRSQIWIHVTEEPKVTAEQTAGKETYTLHDVRLLVKNNQHPLLTEYFRSAVKSARLRKNGDDVELQIQLRKGVGKSTHRLRKRKGGEVSLQIEFPEAPPEEMLPPPSPSPTPDAPDPEGEPAP